MLCVNVSFALAVVGGAYVGILKGTIIRSSMPKNINLSEDGRKPTRREKQVQEAVQTLFGEGPIEKERMELLESIMQQGGVQFSSVASKVTVEFSKFVKMVLTHDLEPLLKVEMQKKGDEAAMEETGGRMQGAGDGPSLVVVSSDLLTDISNCEKLEEDPLDSMNVLSGIYVFGMLSGLILTVIIALVLQYVNFSVSTRDLIFILVGSVVLILIPLMFMAAEPMLRGVQRKHNEFFAKLTGFLGGRR